jgi:hypothetical protein
LGALRDWYAAIERVVASCIDAEFSVYQALPDIDEAPLLRWFRREGGAYRDLVHTLTLLKRRGGVQPIQTLDQAAARDRREGNSG